MAYLLATTIPMLKRDARGRLRRSDRVSVRKALASGRLSPCVARCTYCNATEVDLVWEHVVPLARGGSDEDGNITIACVPCNRAKGTMTPSEWLGDGMTTELLALEAAAMRVALAPLVKPLPAGRPRLPDDERMTCRVEIRVTDAELERIRSEASRAGLTVSDWVRARANAAVAAATKSESPDQP